MLATPGHLEQVLDNLIANALEASPPGGTITIEGDKADYDLLVLVPPHAGQEVVAASGLGDAGAWVPTDRATLAHRDHQQIFALGDATDLPISKSGSTAHFEAPVVASRIASLVRGTAPKANYGGRVMCFLETGDGRGPRRAGRSAVASPAVRPWAAARAWATVVAGDHTEVEKMRVLVAHGSKMGGTAGIAETVGETLREAGLAVEVRAAAEVRDLRPYDAVVVGGALYAGRWHRAARRLVKGNAKALRERPVWLFSSGPLDDSASEREIPPVRQVQALMDGIGARGHWTFGGRLPSDAKGFPASAMAKRNAGDWRDSGQVRAWAARVAEELAATTAS